MTGEHEKGLAFRGYLIALSGIVCLSLAEGLVWIGLVLGGILTWGYWISAVEGKSPVNEAWEKKLMMGAFFLSAVEFLARGTGREAVIFSLGHALALAQCVSAFKDRKANDYTNILTVGAAHLLLAVSFPPMLFTMIYLVGFIVFLPGCLFRLAHLRLLEETTVAAARRSRIPLWPFVLPVTVLAFVAMPRNQSYVRWDLPGRWGVTGLSSRFSIGGLSSVYQSNEVVMRVKATFPSKWRAMAYDTYEDGTWTVSAGTRRPFRARPDEAKKRALLSKDTFLLEQLYWMERPIPDRMLCAVPEVLGIWTDSGALVQTDSLGNLYWYEATRSGFRYRIESAVRRPDPASLRRDQGSVVPPLRYQYTQLPSMGSRVRELAERITESAKTVYDKASAIERYLASEYSYSLSPGAAEGEPVEWFLFESKTGYCEHFATGMVILLRSIGIPSRPVTGFLSGEMVFGDYYLVRSRDAHAWVEVYFPSHGWVSFDPTPAIGSLGPLTRMVRWMSAQWDLLRLKWFRYVVNFSNWNQQRIRSWAQGVRDAVQARVKVLIAGYKAQRWNWKPAWVVSVLVLVSFGVVVLLQWGKAGLGVWLGMLGRVWGFRRMLGEKGEDAETAILFYRRMLKLLKGKGYVRGVCQGPWEFERSLVSLGEEARDEVRTVTRIYCEARFGDRVLGEAGQTQAKESLDRLKERLRVQDKSTSQGWG